MSLELGTFPEKWKDANLVPQVVHKFAVALERKQQVDVIYLDFSKAFDHVSYEKLLFKLECLGIGGSLLDNESSDFLPVTSGVPQGSILGP